MVHSWCNFCSSAKTLRGRKDTLAQEYFYWGGQSPPPPRDRRHWILCQFAQSFRRRAIATHRLPVNYRTTHAPSDLAIDDTSCCFNSVIFSRTKRFRFSSSRLRERKQIVRTRFGLFSCNVHAPDSLNVLFTAVIETRRFPCHFSAGNEKTYLLKTVLAACFV